MGINDKRDNPNAAMRERGERERVGKGSNNKDKYNEFLLRYIILHIICALPQQYQIKSSDRAYYGLKKYKILRTKK